MPNHKFYTLPNLKSLQTTISNWMKMAKSSPKELKTLLEKEKLLVTSNFFSHSVFKIFVLKIRKKPGLIWESVIPPPAKQRWGYTGFMSVSGLSSNPSVQVFRFCALTETL